MCVLCPFFSCSILSRLQPKLIRIMGNPVYTGTLTLEYCAQICHNKKLSLAGVEASHFPAAKGHEFKQHIIRIK